MNSNVRCLHSPVLYLIASPVAEIAIRLSSANHFPLLYLFTYLL